MHRLPLPRLALASLALPFALAGCSAASTQDEEYTAPPAADVPGVEALQPDGSTVGAGQWGVVRYLSTDDEETILAIRTVGVVVGEPGDLREVMVAGQLDLDEATPYYIAYTWTDLSGDDSYSPVQSLAAAGGGEPSTLLVPDDLEKCEPRAATDVTATFGAEQRGCAVAVSIGGRPTGLVFQGPQGSTADVTFELPAS